MLKISCKRKERGFYVAYIPTTYGYRRRCEILLVGNGKNRRIEIRVERYDGSDKVYTSRQNFNPDLFFADGIRFGNVVLLADKSK